MPIQNYQTPGVYIEELNAFPNSVVGVPTAIPAFIGYTPKAEYEGKSFYKKAQRITSFADFKAIYMVDDPAPPADPAVQYNPCYYLVEEAQNDTREADLAVNGKSYHVLPDPNTIYYLYNSIRLFYENGGGAAYIVAVGGYGESSKNPLASPDDAIVNPHVKLAELQAGLELLKNETEPTLYVCPDAMLLSLDDNGSLMESMLLQAATMQTAMCIFDVIGGAEPDPILYTNDIEEFRNRTGSVGLDYGAAYYPFIGTTVMQMGEINYTNLFGGNIEALEALINPSAAPDQNVATILTQIKDKRTTLPVSQLDAALLLASPVYKLIVQHALQLANLLPPSGGIAGVYATTDNQIGVWKAPANMSIVGAANLPIKLSDNQQESLNVDAVTGKSINAIRFFNGRGILIWGARTLDGNSMDWRYIAVRRTVTYLEQSIKGAAEAYIFAPNDANTWSDVKAMIANFLTNVWKQGGLQGAQASEAFVVEIGLGTTMTADDILNGIMRISVKVAVVHPAEFIVITFNQQMASS